MIQNLGSRYSLGIVLTLLFFANWIAYGISIALDSGPFSWRYFWEGTFENATSEFLQLAAFVVLSKYLIFEGSPQSKDGADRHERKTDYLIDITTLKDTPNERPVFHIGNRQGGID
jgi:hypothetical protein